MTSIVPQLTKPQPGHVHFWFAPKDLAAVDRLTQTNLTSLSYQEQARYHSFKTKGAALRFALGRIMLRQTLSRYLGVPVDELEIGIGVHGKPFLKFPYVDGLCFNMSHDGGEMVLAVGGGCEVGVDIVAPDRSEALFNISRQFFSEMEKVQLLRLEKEANVEVLKIWALKESIVKAAGGHIWQGLSDIAISIGSNVNPTWGYAPSSILSLDLSVCLGRYQDDHWIASALSFPKAARQSNASQSMIVSREFVEHGYGNVDFHPISVLHRL